MGLSDPVSRYLRYLVDKVEVILRSLEELQRSYETNLAKVSKRKIGECILDISNRVPNGYDNVLDIRRLIISTMNLVLDISKGQRVLIDSDENNRIPLHIASLLRMPDCVELLLARGADPDDYSVDRDGRQRDHRDFIMRSRDPQLMAIAGLFNFRSLIVWRNSIGHGSLGRYTITWSSDQDHVKRLDHDRVTMDLGIMFPFGIWHYRTHHLTKSSKVWIHVPNNYVSNLLSFASNY